ncbi:MAG: sn-glycerol-3-phosphate ABC transporter ATP-binding protein UgpC [Rhodospirillales bacterium]|nr:sn-glycerol-3-phosphate ABC transporter ATP-binding protein UgpC [Rhodospirillales bacterium]
MGEVVLKGVGKSYGNVVAVRDVNLTIKDQEFVVLVGPSGCGKSTTLRMIAGLEEITAGVIAIGGRVVNQLPPKDRDIAMVFQNYALYQHMSVRDNLAFGLRNRKVPEAEINKQIAYAVKTLGIEPLLERRPRQLSGGQQQRVALGRCLVRNPAVFLFDEPLSNLDAQLRSAMRLELKELRKRVPTTSIYVTHDQVEAMTLGDRIVVMKDGLVQQVGTPLELYRKPANQFVAGFIGSPAMNFIPMQVATTETDATLSAAGLTLKLNGERAAVLRKSGARDIVFGARPQHFVLNGAGSGLLPFQATLSTSEQLGDQQLLDARVGDTPIRIAGVDPFLRLDDGVNLPLGVIAENIHLFDSKTGLALT